MNAGKTLFSQLMDCLPWSTFTRIAARYDGDYDVRRFPCAEQYPGHGVRTAYLSGKPAGH